MGEMPLAGFARDHQELFAFAMLQPRQLQIKGHAPKRVLPGADHSVGQKPRTALLDFESAHDQVLTQLRSVITTTDVLLHPNVKTNKRLAAAHLTNF